MKISDSTGPWSVVYTAESSSVLADLRSVWSYRRLILLLVRRDLRVAYTQTLAGASWLFLQPLLTSLIYVFVFSVIARVPIEGVSPFLYIFSGVALWMFFSDCALTTANVFVANGALFSKVYFPRLCMPCASVCTAFCNFLFRVVPLLAYLTYTVVRGEVSPNYAYLPMVLPVCFGVGAFGMAIGLTVASLAHRFRDLLLALGPLLQFGMFASPVLYQLTMVPAPFRGLMGFNPMAVFIDAFRFCLLGIGSFPGQSLAIFCTVSCLLLLGAVVMFSRAERNVIDHI